MFNYFCFVLFCFSFVSLYHCVSQLHRISWPMIHFRHIWLSSILMNPHPHHLLWQLQSIFYSTPLYSIDDNCPLPSPPLPTLCDNDLYLRKSNDPINKNIYFLDRIIIITVEYSRVLDWLFLWLDIHGCRIWWKKKTLKTRFLRLFLFPSRFSDGEQNVQWTSNHFEPSDHKKVPAVVKQASDITLRMSTSRNFNSRQRAGIEWELVLVFAKKSSCFEAFMAYNFTRPNDLLPHHEWKKRQKILHGYWVSTWNAVTLF